MDFPQIDIPPWPVCSSPKPQGVGGPGPSLDPWAAMAWEQEAGSEQASHCPERRGGAHLVMPGPRGLEWA